MKHVVLICVIFLGHAVSPLRAGSLITLSGGAEVDGKLTLTPTAIRAEVGLSSTEINFSDVLEANFSETPFQLDSFFGNSFVGKQLPAGWQGQDIGAVASHGSVANVDGTFTVSSSGATPKPKKPLIADTLFFAGRPWTGDSQWTARVKEMDMDANASATVAGLMLRDTLNPDSLMVSLGMTNQGSVAFSSRADAGRAVPGLPMPMQLPIWLRLTRYGATAFASISSDGKEWNLVGQSNLKTFANPWIGLFADSHKDQASSNAVIDQVSFTPVPSSAQVLPPGVLLQDGTLLAGAFDHLGFDPAKPGASGDFRMNGRPVAVPSTVIAAVIMLPATRHQIAEMSSHVGLLMKNGDVMDGDFDSISKGAVVISSVLLGNTTYNRSEVRACILHPLQAQPSGNYEIRLKDGSIVNANNFGAFSAGEVVVGEASGLHVPVALNDIAQIRAGPSQVQSMAELDWKATPPPAAPAANAVPNPLPPVPCWEGTNQEYVMEVEIGTTLEFPLTGKFRAMAVRIAVSPDSPPNASAAVRVLADGREIAHTPPFKARDQPRFMEFTLPHSKTVTIQADSIYAGAKVFLIDPVAIRD